MQKRWSLFLIAFVYTGVPLFVYGLRYKVVAPLYLFANDAFYYLDIARHSLGAHGFSFDGSFQTNGFHPLWEYTLVALGKTGLADFSTLTSPLLATFYADTLVLALSAALFCAASSRHLRRPLLALLTVTPGLFWLLTAPFSSAVFCTWSYANGMESALAWFFFGAALITVPENAISSARATILSFLLGLMVLARLDDIFIAAPLLLWVIARPRSSGRRMLFATLSPLAAMLTIYVIYNRIAVGTFLPISGAMKAGFGLLLNLKWTLREFLPLFTGDRPTALRPRLPAYDGFVEISERLLQMLLPAFICAVELFWVRKQKSNPSRTVVHALAVGVILKAAYNFVFVQVWDQGQWYYAVSIAVANLVLTQWVDRLLTRVSRENFLTNATFRLGGVHLLFVLLSFNIFISLRNFVGPHEAVPLIDNPAPLRDRLASLKADRMLEFDDGFTSYVAQVPAVSVTGLALDKQAVAAAKQGRFLDFEYKRGYRFLVARGAYHLIVDDALPVVSRGFSATIGAIRGSDLRLYRIRPLGGDGSSDDLRYYEIVPVTP